MFKLEPIIQSQIDFTALGKVTDISDIDKKHLRPCDKLSQLAVSVFGVDASHQWINIAFFYTLPEEVVEAIVNTNILKVSMNPVKREVQGVIHGSLFDFENFIRLSCSSQVDLTLRQIGNIFYNTLQKMYGIFSNVNIKHLNDNTFSIV